MGTIKIASNKQKRYYEEFKLSAVKMGKVWQSVRFAIVYQNQPQALGCGVKEPDGIINSTIKEPKAEFNKMKKENFDLKDTVKLMMLLLLINVF